jgi:hypothetical protein
VSSIEQKDEGRCVPCWNPEAATREENLEKNAHKEEEEEEERIFERENGRKTI